MVWQNSLQLFLFQKHKHIIALKYASCFVLGGIFLALYLCNFALFSRSVYLFVGPMYYHTYRQTFVYAVHDLAFGIIFIFAIKEQRPLILKSFLKYFPESHNILKQTNINGFQIKCINMHELNTKTLK